MPLTKEERIELLKKAREAKKLKALSNADKKTLDLDISKQVKKDKEKEEIDELVRNEVIKVKAPKKKRIIKRVIEVEEPSTDEEVQEEVIVKERKPKVVEETIISNERGTKANPEKVISERKVSYFSDIFPS